MIVFARSRFAAVFISAIAALLSGCSSPAPIGALATMPQSRAIAPAATGGPCMYLLSTTEASNLSNAQIIAPNCYFYINDTANMKYSVIAAAKILYAGPPPKEIGAMFPGATPAPGPPVTDPCPTIPGCSYLTVHPPSTSNCKPAGHYKDATILPGCYKGLELQGTDTLKPGLYVIDGQQLQMDAATVTGSGVTIYMTAYVKATNFADSRLTLSAPISGNYDGVLFYRVPLQTAAINFSACVCNFAGILYFPTTSLTYADTGGNYQLLIFGNANLSTSQGVRFGPP